MRALLSATCLTPVILSLAAPARADTTISTATTANLRTSTAASSAPDNIVVTSAGSVSPASGTAVTIDSNNNVSNAGAIKMTGVNGAIGIAASGGLAASITNTGTITLDEDYTRADGNADGVLDGPFAQGSDRYGIRITGAQAFVGAISSSGVITVEGNNSGGIVVDAPLTGSVTTTAATSVTGDNSYGIRLGAVDGKVTVSGATTVVGANSIGVALTGDITGQATIHSGVSSTGYSSTTLPTTTSSLTAENLAQGGPAVLAQGNIGGGLLIAAAPSDTTNTTADVDGDGLADAGQGTGILASTGSAPALLIGSADRAITLGTVASSTGGLVINGTVIGNGVYSGYDGAGVRIGGLGQTVNASGGAVVGGSISALSNGARAIALDLQAGTILPSLTNSGTISAASTTTAGGSAYGVRIAAGASLPTISNSGTISASPPTSADSAAAILDLSGTLLQVSNSGTIKGTGNAATSSAIDVSTNTAGFSYVQQAPSSGSTVPSLTGAIVTGGGNDVVAISAGSATSALRLGAGNDRVALSGSAALKGDLALGDGDDTLTLADGSSYTGAADFGGGANSVAIAGTSVFSGTIASSGSVGVSVQGGRFNVTGNGVTSISQLTLNGGTLGIAVDSASGAHSQVAVAGTTTIGSGSAIGVTVTNLPAASTRYTVLTSGVLNGAGNLSLAIDSLPYLVTGSLDISVPNSVAVVLTPRAAADIGFSPSEGAAYPAAYAAIAADSTLTNLFISLPGRDAFLSRYRQLLPDHAGGVFDVLQQGSRLILPSVSMPRRDAGELGIWAQQAYWTSDQDGDLTPGYHGSGFGIGGGIDRRIGAVGRIGLFTAYTYASVREPAGAEVTAHQFEVGPSWISQWGGLQLAASGSFGFVSLGSTRELDSAAASPTSLLSSDGSWHGTSLAGSLKLSYEGRAGILYLRPSAGISYYRLHEKGYQESGDASYALAVGARTSDETAATAMFAAGLRLGSDANPELPYLRIELEGGRRQILSGSVGSTTAHFANGSNFTLLPEDRKSGYLGSLTASYGAANARVTGTVSAEQRNGYTVLVGKIGVRGAF